MYVTVAAGNPCDLRLLDDAHLSINEKSKVIIFYTELISKFAGKIVNDIDWIRSLEDNADTLVGLEYINKGYEEALSSLIGVGHFEPYHLRIRICLGVIAALQLDLKKLEKQISSMREMEADPFLEYPINPLYCLETIYYYLKFGTVKVEALRMLTKFYFNPQMSGSIPRGFKEILYLLGLYTLQICNNNLKSMRYVRVLNKIYPSGSSGYQFLLKAMSAETLINLDEKDEALELYQELTKQYRIAPNNFTSFMKVSYYSLRVKIENLDTCPKSEQINALVQFCDDSLYKLTKVRSLAFFLNYPSVKDEPIYDKFYRDIIKTTSINGCRVESFVNQ